MSVRDQQDQRQGSYVHANGVDIHYVEAGAGEPLVLLHGALVSTNPIWAGVPFSYQSHMEVLAERFHVIAPDTRGGGRTVHTEGVITYDMLAEDVLALIEALDLDRPAVMGFSDGALIATVAAIRRPGALRAIVNHAGYDLFNLQAPSFAIGRQMLGGSPQAAEPDPEAVARFFAESDELPDELRAVFDLMKTDHDSGQGAGHWKEYVRLLFHRITEPMGYTFDDLCRITAPTLILVGDRDIFCSVEEGVSAWRALNDGEFAVLPATPHRITTSAVQTSIEFLERHAGQARFQ